jgi:Zn-dependent peptidase ImmA (M78 family)/transcriptional regulator with XRE-family HTH domain
MASITVPITPRVLRWARETAGFSLDDTAHRLGEQLQRVQAWETGSEQPNVTSARALAALYGRPLAAFLLPEPPTEPPTPVDFRQGTGTGQITSPTHFAVRAAMRVQDSAAELFDALGIVPQWGRGSVGEESDVALAAEDARGRLDVSLAEQASWRDPYRAFAAWRAALGRTGALVLQRKLPLAEVRGFSLTTPGPPTLVVNRSDAVSARIFTTFHELGHILLGTGGICLPATAPEALVLAPREEVFCNAFAGQLLVPSGALMTNSTVAEIRAMNRVPSDADLAPLTARFSVSAQVIWFRLHALDYVNDERYRAKWAQWQQRKYEPGQGQGGGGETGAARTLHENGGAYVSAVLEARNRGLVSLAQVTEWLEVRSRDVLTLEEQLSAAGAG